MIPPLKNTRRELWLYGPAAFNVCGIAYQRSVMYQSADSTSVWRTMPTQLKTFRAYYPSLTLQPLLPSPTKNDSPWSNTMTRLNVMFPFSFLFLFLFFRLGQTSPAGLDYPHADGALLLLPPPAADRRKRLVIKIINSTQCGLFKNICHI